MPPTSHDRLFGRSGTAGFQFKFAEQRQVVPQVHARVRLVGRSIQRLAQGLAPVVVSTSCDKQLTQILEIIRNWSTMPAESRSASAWRNHLSPSSKLPASKCATPRKPATRPERIRYALSEVSSRGIRSTSWYASFSSVNVRARSTPAV